MDVLIVEDEYLLADELEEMILRLEPQAKVKGKLSSIQESVKWLESNEVDLIFLDIQLSDGLSFTIFDQVKVTAPVIFTTAFDSYAIRAFEVNSIYYLLKPVSEEQLMLALQKYNQQALPNETLPNALTALLSRTNEAIQYKRRIIVHIGTIQKPVEIEQIAYFMADDKYLYAILNDGKKFFYDSTLAKLENEIDPSIFFRINRKFFVNISSIVEMIQYSNSRVKLKLNPEPEEDVLISYSRNNLFKEWLTR